MKFFCTILGSVIILIMSQPAISQDQIIKKNKDTIPCKVREIGMDEIKYSLPEYPTDLLFSIDKENVDRIVFGNGQEMTFQHELTNPDNYLDNKRNAIKVDFLSPLTGNTTLYYERSIRPGRSIEASLGLIGLGKNVGEYNASGVFLKFGPKFIKSPDFYLRGMRYAHVLKGTYVKPELTLGYYARTFENWFYDGYMENYRKERKSVFSGAILLNVGKQWVFDNSFLVDFFFGVGYGFDSIGDEYFDDNYHFSFIKVDDEIPLSFSAGLKMGGLFK